MIGVGQHWMGRNRLGGLEAWRLGVLGNGHWLQRIISLPCLDFGVTGLDCWSGGMEGR